MKYIKYVSPECGTCSVQWKDLLCDSLESGIDEFDLVEVDWGDKL